MHTAMKLDARRIFRCRAAGAERKRLVLLPKPVLYAARRRGVSLHCRSIIQGQRPEDSASLNELSIRGCCSMLIFCHQHHLLLFPVVTAT